MKDRLAENAKMWVALVAGATSQMVSTMGTPSTVQDWAGLGVMSLITAGLVWITPNKPKPSA